MQTAFADIQSNPGNIAKYQNDPKMQKVMEKLEAKISGGGPRPSRGPPSGEEPKDPPTHPSATPPSAGDMGLD